MEHWQKEQIKTNLSSLVNNTSINALFLAELQQDDVLSDIDVAQIVAKETNYDQAKLLYEIIMTKANSYYTLIKALTETQQSGATKHLFHPTERIRNLKVHFQGNTLELRNFLNIDQINAIQAWLLNSEFSDSERKTFTQILNEEREVKLLRDTIPKPYALYIPRYVSVPQIVDPNLFQKSCPDTFVFKYVERSLLRKFVNTYEIESSTRLLLRKKISSRFILLDSQNDWKKICARIEDTPVHLLRYDDKLENFVLEATCSGSDILREHLKYKHADPEYISEEEFVEQVLAKDVKGMCICDLPGMGKSDLLASIARRIKEKCPESITVFIQLRDFILSETLSEHKRKILDHISTSKLATEILDELTNANIQFNLFFDGLDEVDGTYLETMTKFLHEIGESITEVKLFVTSRPVVRTELEKSLGLIAYDILPFNEETQRNYLTAYWTQENPSSDKQKLNEFAEFCVQHFGKALKTNIKTISGVPLQCQLIAEVYCDDAAVFADKDRKTDVNLPENIANSLSEIYSKYMLRQLGPSKCRFACMHNLSVLRDKPQCGVVCKVKSFHVWEALKLIYWDFAREIMYKEYVAEFDDLKPNQILGPGVLKPGKSEDTYEFLHRTFAEFLVAEYVSKVLFSKPRDLKRNKIYDKIADEFSFDRLLTSYSVYKRKTLETSCSFEFYSLSEALLPYFLNVILTKRFNADDELCVGVLSPVYTSDLNTVAGCLHADYQAILKVLLQGLTNFEQQSRSWLFKAIRVIDRKEKWEVNMYKVLNILQVAAQYSDVKTLDQLFRFFENGLYFDMKKLSEFETDPSKPLPMKVAVKRGDFHVVKYLTNKFNLKNLGLLYWCFKDTYGANEEILDAKLEIAEFLLSKQADLLIEEAYLSSTKDKLPVILSPNIHLKAVRFLVEKGVSVQQVDKWNSNVYINALEYMSDEDFEKLRNFLFLECKAQDWFLDVENYKKYFCPFGVYQIRKAKTVLRFLDNVLKEAAIMHENQNAKVDLLRNDFYKGIFFHAVATGIEEIVDFFLEQDHTFLELRYTEKHSPIFLHLFNFKQLEYNAKISPELRDGEQLEHSENVTSVLLAAKFGQAEIVRFLVNRGANIFAVDQKGRTLLHMAALSTKSKAFYQIVSIVGEKWYTTYTTLPNYQEDSNSQTEPADVQELFNWHDNVELNTPLHLAAKYIDFPSECLSLFLSCGQTSQPFTLPKLQPFQFSLPDIQTTELVNKLPSFDFDNFKKKLDESQKQLELSLQTLDFKFLPGEKIDKSICVNINAINKNGHSPLHIALFHGRDLKLVQHFVSMGADWTIKDDQGCNVTHICAHMMLPNHLKYLLNLGGIDFANQLDNLGNNALHCAIANLRRQGGRARYFPEGREMNQGEVISILKEIDSKMGN